MRSLFEGTAERCVSARLGELSKVFRSPIQELSSGDSVEPLERQVATLATSKPKAPPCGWWLTNTFNGGYTVLVQDLVGSRDAFVYVSAYE